MVVRLRKRLTDRGQHRLSRDPLRPRPHPAHRRRHRKDLSSSLRDGLTSCSPSVARSLADGRLRQVEPLRGAMEAPALATATKARNNSKFSMQLILFFDQSYY